MRPRNKSGALAKCDESPWCLRLDDFNRQNLCHLYRNKKLPIFVEIGCGKGGFLLRQAEKNQDANWLGIEKIPVIILKAIRLIEGNAPKLKNLMIARGDAKSLSEQIAPHSLSGIFLNFSDPWPKKRHAKRRLVHASFLTVYAQLLIPGSPIEFKTDQKPLFDFLLEEIAKLPNAKIRAMTRDLYALSENDPLRVDNVQTEYEQKFVAVGNPIHKIIFTLN